jgi:hypothetical protein
MWVVLDLKADFNSANLLLLDMQAKKKQEEHRHLVHSQPRCTPAVAGVKELGLRGCVEEPGVLPPRNGAVVASRSRGSSCRGMK